MKHIIKANAFITKQKVKHSKTSTGAGGAKIK